MPWPHTSFRSWLKSSMRLFQITFSFKAWHSLRSLTIPFSCFMFQPSSHCHQTCLCKAPRLFICLWEASSLQQGFCLFCSSQHVLYLDRYLWHRMKKYLFRVHRVLGAVVPGEGCEKTGTCPAFIPFWVRGRTGFEQTMNMKMSPFQTEVMAAEEYEMRARIQRPGEKGLPEEQTC